MNRPIMLWMTSRSRSSLVSRIFAEHGVWWGEHQTRDPAGYDWYENLNIKKLHNKYKPQWGRPYMRPVGAPMEVFKQFQSEVLKEVSGHDIWSMKTGVEYFPAYKALNPYNIFIYRPPEDVTNSLCKKQPNRSYDETIKTVVWRYEYMKELLDKYGGRWVETDNIINNDFTEIREALEYCGIGYNEEKTKRAIIR